MDVVIELYGVLRRLAGASSIVVQLPTRATVSDAIAAVEMRVPDITERLEVTA